MESLERRTRLARLLVAPPSFVYDELKQYSADVQASPWTAQDDAIEIALGTRNDPLINLGLASYGACREVVGALYLKGKEPPAEGEYLAYKQGLRLAVLGNETIDAKGFLSRFPQNTIGDEETVYVLHSAEWAEVETLVSNPTVNDDVLTAIYSGQKLAAGMDETRRRQLVTVSGRNERLFNRNDTIDGPDMGHYYIHKAIFEMLEGVPTSEHWAHTLSYFLRMLDPQHTYSPDSIDAVLERWRFDENGEAVNLDEGDKYTETGHSLRQELRCLIGGLYGRHYAKKSEVVQGKADDEDVVRRCAFYGKGKLDVKAIEAGYERDKETFVFVAMLNDGLFYDRKARRVFEEECLNGNQEHRYRRRLEQIQKRWPSFDTRPLADWMVDREEEKVSFATERQVEAVHASVRELQQLAMYAPWFFLALVAVVAWR
jgi:hypothetical protein